MPAQLQNVPDLSPYSSYHHFKRDNPSSTMSNGSFYRYKRDQVRNIITGKANNTNRAPDVCAHDIIDRETSIQKSNSLLKSQEISEKKEYHVNMPEIGQNARIYRQDLLTPEKREELVNLAILSVKHHIPMQWQCAMTALERLLPDHFAKRESSGPVTAIGIRVTFGQREKCVSK